MQIYKNTLTDKSVTIDFGNNVFIAYVNSARGRGKIEKECDESTVQDVMKVWGVTPIVVDPIITIAPDNDFSDLDVIGAQLAEMLLGM